MTGVRKYGILGAAFATLALSACVDEEIVYRDKPLFEDPPQAAVGFLGYSNADTKQTTCGNCHAGQQVAWKESNHAKAWGSMKESPGAADYCIDCHAVTSLGNIANGDTKVAYAATKDARYEDVQCESCHGGGLEHVTNPSQAQPKASIMAGESLSNGCGECHSGEHNPFVEQWEASRHAEVNESVKEDLELDYAAYSAPGQCGSCHEGKIALKNQFNVTSEFTESGNQHELVGITCAVCHDPHGNGNKAQLRMLANSPAPESNLCFKCHNRRAQPSGSTTRNYSHAAQGPTIFGDIGWRPPNFPSEKIYGTHSSEANQGLCATCHLATFAVNDKVTGTLVENNVGHLFKALPCLDAQGVPSADESCQMTQRSFKGCVASGCHGTEASARGATAAVESRITNLSTELKRLVALAKVKAPGDWKSDTNVTPLEGADFNSHINEHDLSRGVHNPFLLEALLNASISYVKSYYQVQ